MSSHLIPQLHQQGRLLQKKTQTGTAAMKRKNIKASANFELIHAHDLRSFQQRLTQNTKCLQIGLFLMDFIFGRSAPVEVSARTKFYFAMFSGCYFSHRFLWSCVMAFLSCLMALLQTKARLISCPPVFWPPVPTLPFPTMCLVKCLLDQ